MSIIKEITDKCFELNSLASKITPETTVEELNLLRKEIDSLRVMVQGLRVDATAINTAELTFTFKLLQMFQAITPNQQTPPPGWFDNNKYWVCN